MYNECGIYFRYATGEFQLVHNEPLVTAQARVDKYNELYIGEEGGRYLIGPWIDFANGPVIFPKGI